MRETRDLLVAGLRRFSHAGSNTHRFDVDRSAHAVDQPRNVAGWIGKHGDGEVPHVGDRHHDSGAQPLGLGKVCLHVVDSGIDRDTAASGAILVSGDAAVDAAFTARLNYAILPLVIAVDLPVEELPIKTLQRRAICAGDLEMHHRIWHNNAPLQITGLTVEFACGERTDVRYVAYHAVPKCQHPRQRSTCWPRQRWPGLIAP